MNRDLLRGLRLIGLRCSSGREARAFFLNSRGVEESPAERPVQLWGGDPV